MAIAWYPNRWWRFCVPEDRKKKLNRFLLSNTFHVYNLRLKIFETLDIGRKSL